MICFVLALFAHTVVGQSGCNQCAQSSIVCPTSVSIGSCIHVSIECGGNCQVDVTAESTDGSTFDVFVEDDSSAYCDISLDVEANDVTCFRQSYRRYAEFVYVTLDNENYFARAPVRYSIKGIVSTPSPTPYFRPTQYIPPTPPPTTLYNFPTTTESPRAAPVSNPPTAYDALSACGCDTCDCLQSCCVGRCAANGGAMSNLCSSLNGLPTSADCVCKPLGGNNNNVGGNNNNAVKDGGAIARNSGAADSGGCCLGGSVSALGAGACIGTYYKNTFAYEYSCATQKSASFGVSLVSSTICTQCVPSLSGAVIGLIVAAVLLCCLCVIGLCCFSKREKIIVFHQQMAEMRDQKVVQVADLPASSAHVQQIGTADADASEMVSARYE